MNAPHDHAAHGHAHAQVHEPKNVPPAPTGGPTVSKALAGTIHTCPMHPQIRLPQPGSCPICGMTLEPVMPTLDDDENPELADFQRRFWGTLPLTIIAVLLPMLGHRLDWFQGAPHTWAQLPPAHP